MNINGPYAPYTPHRSGFAAYVQQHLLPNGAVIITSRAVKGDRATRFTFYAVITDAQSHFYALIMPTEFRKTSGQRYIAYDEFNEQDSPAADDCPGKILSLLETIAPLPTLSPLAQIRALAMQAQLTSGIITLRQRSLLAHELARTDPDAPARNWRARCHANLARVPEQPSPKSGDLIHFRTPLTVAGGLSVQDCYLARHRRGWPLSLHHAGLSYDVPDWRSLPFTVTGRKNATDAQRNAAGFPVQP